MQLSSHYRILPLWIISDNFVDIISLNQRSFNGNMIAASRSRHKTKWRSGIIKNLTTPGNFCEKFLAHVNFLFDQPRKKGAHQDASVVYIYLSLLYS